MVFNIEYYKKNKLFLLLTIILIAILIMLNTMVYGVKEEETSLEDEEIDISKLVINEIMTSNKGVQIDDNGDSYDWIEIYNGGNKDIDLTNYGLSDNANGEIKWLFPSVIIPKKSYLLVYLVGENRKGLYANFLLKQEGKEIITFKSSSGKVIDTVETVVLSSNYSMYRDSNGKWGITEEITPGYENNVVGRNTYLYAYKEIRGNETLIISELLPSNEGNVMFDDKLYSYIELTNIGEECINLNEYYLTNDDKALYKWRLPEIELGPNTSYLIFTNKLDKDNNASFGLKNKNGKVLLTSKYGIIDQVQYEDLTNGMAYIREDNKWLISTNISPGYRNDTGGKIEYQKSLDIPKKDLVINEIMSSNGRYLAQNGNQFYDWIELYNNSDKDILLSDYYLTTDKDDKAMFNLPQVVVHPRQYYILMASGDTSLSNSYIHTNFKLSASKGLLLYNGDYLVDSLFIPSIPRNNSYGRGNIFGHYYYTQVTPGYMNDNNGLSDLSYEPVFDKKAGSYNNVSSLEININSSGDIYYTLDGTNPNNNSLKYDKPIVIDKTTIVKAVAYENNKVTSNIVSNTYFINENHSLPIMSISLPINDFNNIQANTYGKNIVNAHVEFYEKDSSFSMDCGFKLFGGESRTLSKKSFALKFNDNYGGALHYKVFDNKDIRKFNTLVLRSGSQDQISSMIRDEFISTMLVNYGTLLAQAAKPIVLYIDGNYWGIYFIREKIDDDFIENNNNIKGTTNIVNYNYTAEEGSNSDFLKLKSFVVNNDMRDSNNYEYIKTILDVDSFIDYHVCQFIINNTDLHNVRFYNNNLLDNGRIKAILYDTDYGLTWDYYVYYLTYLQNPYTLQLQPDTSVIRGLMNNGEFRNRFIERISYYIRNVWTEEHIVNTYNYFYNSIKPEMNRNAHRWGQDYNNWERSVEKLKNNALLRIKNVPKYAKAYFSLSEEVYNGYFG